MNIITISREFGSGGRELGKRLAELFNYDYYDREIITAIAAKKRLDDDYVEKALESHSWQTIPLTFRHSFSSINRIQSVQTNLLVEQKHVIEEIAKAGKNCVIVGRNADVILAEQKPFCIFVCADKETKIRRCIERADKGENLSRKEIINYMQRINKNRAKTREMLAGGKWSDCSTYHLVVNTTDWNIKNLTLAVAEFVSRWFGR